MNITYIDTVYIRNSNYLYFYASFLTMTNDSDSGNDNNNSRGEKGGKVSAKRTTSAASTAKMLKG